MKTVLSISTDSRAHWVGNGFPVKTLFSYQTHGKSISPFLLLDYAGPMHFSPSDQKRGVGQHPHRGFETVTLVYQGEVAHKDSTGEHGVIGPGDVQWMTAAKGILHEEFHSPAFTKSGGMLEMIQLWVNLPSKSKMTSAQYQGISAANIPVITLPNQHGTVRLIAGEVADLIGPAQTHSPILVMDGMLKSAGNYNVSVAEGWSASVIVRSGQLRVNGRLVSKEQTIILSQTGQDIELTALQDSEFIILSGEPINEPIIGYGPFVMNTEAEIKQAMSDFQNGKFAQ